MVEFTTDTFYNGDISLRQERWGYRFSLDAVLLASHVHPKPPDRVLDLGTGCGVIPLLLAVKNPEALFYGVEVQKELAELAVWNASHNNLGDRLKILCCDLKELNQNLIGTPVDIILSNPPYRRLDSGRINPNPQRAMARHEIMTSLPEITKAAKRLLKVSGVLAMIYPANRITDLLCHMREQDIEPKWMRLVHSFAGDPPKLVLVKGVKGAGPDVTMAPPLVVYEKEKVYTREVMNMFGNPKTACSSPDR